MQNKLTIEVQPHQFADLQKLLDRGLNTWEPHLRPAWIDELEAKLQEQMDVAHIQIAVGQPLASRDVARGLAGGAADPAPLSACGIDDHPADSYPSP